MPELTPEALRDLVQQKDCRRAQLCSSPRTHKVEHSRDLATGLTNIQQECIDRRAVCCVECLAHAARRRAWSESECDVLRKDWGKRSPRAIAERICKQTGSARTAYAVTSRAHILGLDYRTNQPEYWTVRELCDTLDLTIDIVSEARRKALIRPVNSHTAAISYFGPAAYDILARLYPPVPFERVVTAGKAAAVLGYRETHIGRLMRAGVIRAVQRGNIWHVDAATGFWHADKARTDGLGAYCRSCMQERVKKARGVCGVAR